MSQSPGMDPTTSFNEASGHTRRAEALSKVNSERLPEPVQERIGSEIRHEREQADLARHSAQIQTQSPTSDTAVQGPVSKTQIKDLNDSRPQPRPALVNTPTGHEWQQALDEAAQQENAEIDRKIAEIERRLEAKRLHARNAFNREK